MFKQKKLKLQFYLYFKTAVPGKKKGNLKIS